MNNELLKKCFIVTVTVGADKKKCVVSCKSIKDAYGLAVKYFLDTIPDLEIGPFYEVSAEETMLVDNPTGDECFILN